MPKGAPFFTPSLLTHVTDSPRFQLPEPPNSRDSPGAPRRLLVAPGAAPRDSFRRPPSRGGGPDLPRAPEDRLRGSCRGLCSGAPFWTVLEALGGPPTLKNTARFYDSMMGTFSTPTTISRRGRGRGEEGGPPPPPPPPPPSPPTYGSGGGKWAHHSSRSFRDGSRS